LPAEYHRVAWPLCCPAFGWLIRRPTFWRTPHRAGRRRGTPARAHLGDPAQEHHAWEHALHGRACGHEPDDGQSGCGAPSVCSLIGRKPSSPLRIRLSWTRCAMLLACICARGIVRWCSALMRSRRSKRWRALPRCCRCGPGQPERHTHDYTRHGTLDLFAARGRKGGHGHRFLPGTAPQRGVSRLSGHHRLNACPPAWKFTSSSTTPPFTRPS
jgi:hypothetical protein